MNHVNLVNIGVIYGVYRNNGKENENYCLGFRELYPGSPIPLK